MTAWLPAWLTERASKTQCCSVLGLFCLIRLQSLADVLQ